MHLGGGLPVVGAEDAPGVLDEPALVGDGRGEEEGVEGGQAKPSPAYGPVATASSGGPPGRFLQPLQGGGPLLRAHGYLQILLAGGLVIGLGLAMGYRPAGGAAGVLAATALVVLFASALSWAWITLGLVLRSPNAVMSIGFVILPDRRRGRR